jgi:hypothetical protein
MQAIETRPVAAAHVPQDLAHELALAKRRARPIHKAARVAAFNGWTIGIVAMLSAPFAPFSIAGFLMAVALSVVAWNEFQGRKRLLAFDPASATFLGWNQIGFLAFIAAYCLWMIHSSSGSFTAEMQAHPEFEQALGPLDGYDSLYRSFVVLFYGTVILFSAFFQGLNAVYYFTRRKHLDAYRRETPAWVQDVQRMASVG